MTRKENLFPPKFKFPRLIFVVSPLKFFASPSRIVQVPSQIIGENFLSPSWYFHSLLKMYNFIISLLYLYRPAGSLLGGVRVDSKNDRKFLV